MRSPIAQYVYCETYYSVCVWDLLYSMYCTSCYKACGYVVFTVHVCMLLQCQWVYIVTDQVCAYVTEHVCVCVIQAYRACVCVCYTGLQSMCMCVCYAGLQSMCVCVLYRPIEHVCAYVTEHVCAYVTEHVSAYVTEHVCVCVLYRPTELDALVYVTSAHCVWRHCPRGECVTRSVDTPTCSVCVTGSAIACTLTMLVTPDVDSVKLVLDLIWVCEL